jgi:hypothetical protein
MNNNIPSITIQQAEELLYRFYKVKKETGTSHVLNLIGNPGTGKTSIVEKHAQNLMDCGEEKDVTVLSYRLNQVDPTDLKGVPVYEKLPNGLQTCSFAPPRVFPIANQPDSGNSNFNIMFLDEFNQAPQTIQNLGANIIDGKVGDHNIDINRSQIVLAGNTIESLAAVFDVPANLKTRILSFRLVADFNSWKPWALDKQIHPAIIGYLEQMRDSFENLPTQADTDDFASSPNPRTWHKLSDYIRVNEGTYGSKETEVLDIKVTQAYLGMKVGSAFYQFFQLLQASFNINDIVEGKQCGFNKYENKDMVYSILYELSYRLRNIADQAHQAKLSKGDDAIHLLDYLTSNDIGMIENISSWVKDDKIEKSLKLTLTRGLTSRESYRQLKTTSLLDDKNRFPQFTSLSNLMDTALARASK